mmetsp:Transcript_18944/g.19062  ORF Transcript_18944/g.19062 Transcript_18944/m.19062 type:complete len:159 (-) Transcript_18944:105-581(-)
MDNPQKSFEEQADISDEIIEILRSTSTNNQWSLLARVHVKINKKLSKPLTVQQLDIFLQNIPHDELVRKGIWIHSFGSKYMPIICLNPAYGRANDTIGLDRPCTCRVSKQTDNELKRYFHSSDYNAGRHMSTNSSHIATCIEWTPSATGHLHSWRRGY